MVQSSFRIFDILIRLGVDQIHECDRQTDRTETQKSKNLKKIYNIYVFQPGFYSETRLSPLAYLLTYLVATAAHHLPSAKDCVLRLFNTVVIAFFMASGINIYSKLLISRIRILDIRN